MVEFDIVQADLLTLIRKNVLDREQLVADTVFNRLSLRISFDISGGNMGYMDEWFVPLFRSSSGNFF